MNKIEKKFQELKKNRRKAFVAFITAGDPDLKTTQKLVLGLEAAGVDIIELGIPFSDPLADGPTIQASNLRALKKGATVKKILETVKDIRRHTSIPIAFMSSYNPILHFGEEKFVKACAEVGVDGLIIPDLPPEEAHSLRQAAGRHHIATIFFVAPTSQDERIKANAKVSSGFIYYVSLAGITGTKKAISSSVIKNIKRIRRFSSKPVCVGFGISTPQQVKEIGRAADGVIVGSAIVKAIHEHKGSVSAVSRYVSSLVRALK
jgi:tryptophan synthase alpha chain